MFEWRIVLGRGPSPPFQGGEHPLPAAFYLSCPSSWEPPPDRGGLIDIRADYRPAALVLDHSIVGVLRLLLPLFENSFARGVFFLRSSDAKVLSGVRGLADLQMRFGQAGDNFGIAIVRTPERRQPNMIFSGFQRRQKQPLANSGVIRTFGN